MNRGLLFFIGIIFLVASLGFGPAGQSIPPRPEISLDAAGQTVKEPFAAYCWPTATGNNQCDFVPNPTPISTLQVPLGQAITILVTNSPTNMSALTVTINNSIGIQGHNLAAEPQAIFDEVLPLGENRFQVDASYSDVAGVPAFVSYIFNVFVYDPAVPPTTPTLDPSVGVAADATALATEEALPIPTEEVLPVETEVVEVALATQEVLPLPPEEVLPLPTEEVLPVETEVVEVATEAAIIPTEAVEVATEAPTEPVVLPTEVVEVATEAPTEPSALPTEVVELATEAPTEVAIVATEEAAPLPTEAVEVATEEATEVVEVATEAPTATIPPTFTATPTVAVVAETTETVEVVEVLPADITPTITPTPEPVSLIPTQQSEALPTATTVALVVQPTTEAPASAEARPTSTTIPLVVAETTEEAATDSTEEVVVGVPSATPTEEPIGQPETAPEAQMVFAGRTFGSVGVSFCSVNDSNQRICVDTPLESDADAISLLQGFAAQIQLVDSPRPAQIEVAFLNPTNLNVVQSESRPGDRLVLLNVNAPVGEYIVRVNVVWGSSTAQYFFRVRVN